MTNATSRTNPVIEKALELKPQFQRLTGCSGEVRLKGDFRQKLKGCRKLAHETAEFMKARYASNELHLPEEQRKYNSVRTRNSALIKELKRLAEGMSESASIDYLAVVQLFRDELINLFSRAGDRNADEYNLMIDQRSSSANLVEIDPSPFIQKAYDVLKQVSDHPETPATGYWKDVSCALALVWGKRMSEIHATAEFYHTGEYTGNFKGQVKGKGRVNAAGENIINHEFKNVTLVPAEWVERGLIWLEAKGRRIETDPETLQKDQNLYTKAVNQRYCKDLNINAKTHWNVLGQDDFSYHDLRAVFLICAAKAEAVQPQEYAKLASQWIGDEGLKAQMAYARYHLAENATVRI